MSHIRNSGFNPIPNPNSHMDVYPDPDTNLVWLTSMLKINEKIVYSAWSTLVYHSRRLTGVIIFFVIVDSLLQWNVKIHLFGTDTNPDWHALDADPDPCRENSHEMRYGTCSWQSEKSWGGCSNARWRTVSPLIQWEVLKKTKFPH